MAEAQDYFSSNDHETRVNDAVNREQVRLQSIAERDGPMAAISDAMGSMSAHIAVFRALGLKNVAVKLLQDALKYARKGV